MDIRQVLRLFLLAFTIVVTNGTDVPALVPSWPNGVVPYTLDSTQYAKDANVQFLAAAKTIQTATCVKFIPRTTEKDYLHFTNGRYVTRAPVGKIGGKQEMTLYVRAPKWQMLALLMQTLGFYNEFQRTDRDSFISINRTEIMISKAELKIVPGYNAAVAGSPFDVKSVLHTVPFFPPEKEFLAKTITVKNSKEAFGGWDTLSNNDIFKINTRYHCQKSH